MTTRKEVIEEQILQNKKFKVYIPITRDENSLEVISWSLNLIELLSLAEDKDFLQDALSQKNDVLCRVVDKEHGEVDFWLSNLLNLTN